MSCRIKTAITGNKFIQGRYLIYYLKVFQGWKSANPHNLFWHFFAYIPTISQPILKRNSIYNSPIQSTSICIQGSLRSFKINACFTFSKYFQEDPHGSGEFSQNRFLSLPMAITQPIDIRSQNKEPPRTLHFKYLQNLDFTYFEISKFTTRSGESMRLLDNKI